MNTNVQDDYSRLFNKLLPMIRETEGESTHEGFTQWIRTVNSVQQNMRASERVMHAVIELKLKE
jgi:hypothetical protein